VALVDKANRRQEIERLRAVLLHVRDQLDVLIGHLEEDVLPPRMVAASAHQLLNTAAVSTAFATEHEPRHDDRQKQ